MVTVPLPVGLFSEALMEKGLEYWKVTVGLLS